MSKIYKILFLSVNLFFITNEVWMAQPGGRKIALLSPASQNSNENKELTDKDVDQIVENVASELSNVECKKTKEEIKATLKDRASLLSEGYRHRIAEKFMQKAVNRGSLLWVQALIELGIPFTGSLNDIKKIKNDSLRNYLQANFDLRFSILSGSVPQCKDALEKGAYVNVRRDFGCCSYDTPLHLAAYHRREEMVKILIKYKADVNAQDGPGCTPLHTAIVTMNMPMHVQRRKEQRSIIKQLLTAKARTDIKDSEGWTALDLAKKYGLANLFAEFGIK